MTPAADFGQIGQEIAWFQGFYQTKAKVFIAYDRMAFAGINDPELRITFDTNMRWRDNNLDLRLGDSGQSILPANQKAHILMEIKIPGACPLWLSRLLSEIEVFPTSFSKYGFCYREHILQNTLKNNLKNNQEEVDLCA